MGGKINGKDIGRKNNRNKKFKEYEYGYEKRIIPLDRLSRNNIKTSSVNLPTIQSICQILLNNKLTTAVVDKDNSILLPLFARTITSPG